jgi:DNA-binding IclR family transcriptional regulator
MPANNYIFAVERAMLVLESFRGEKNVRLAELAARTKLVKSSVFRILFTLERLGYVEKGGDGLYSLTRQLGRLGGTARPEPDLALQAAPFMAKLLHRFQETVNLGVLDDGEVLYIRVMESPQVFRLAAHAGMRSPVHSTALGKCLLSRMEPAQVDEILSRHPMRASTPKTLRDRSSFDRELKRVRQQGYALDDEEDSAGIRCLAAPILDPAGNVTAAMSISAPAVRLQPERDGEVAAALKEACGHLSTLQGYTRGRLVSGAGTRH